MKAKFSLPNFSFSYAFRKTSDMPNVETKFHSATLGLHISAHVGVHAIIVSRNGNVLLQQKTVDSNYKYSGKIGVFGGSLDEGEELVAGLRRELLEELELDINDYSIKKLGVYEKTKEVDGIAFSIHTWMILDVDENMLKLHEGASIVSEKAEVIINNPNLTRITKLALQDYLNNTLHI